MEKRNLRLLILDDSPNEAENYAVIFRNAGYATRLHRITSAQDASIALTQVWDLLITAPNSENLDPEALLTMLKSKQIDIPCIQLLTPADIVNDDRVVSFLKKGVQDVLSTEVDDDHLLLVANRELTNLFKRRALIRAEKSLAESERRCHLLLDSSKDAIAYIHDGMHVYLNQSYISLFGYKDKTDMEALPIIDLISAEDPNDLKELFKHRVESSLTCKGIHRDGSKFPILISTYPASYDGEDCMQVIIREESSINSEELEEKIRAISSLDPVTGLFNRAYFSTLMNEVMNKVKTLGVKECLAYIRIDNFDALAPQIGIAGSDNLLSSLGELLKEHFIKKERVARLSDDVFVVLAPNVGSKELATSIAILQDKINKQLFDVNDFSLQITVSVGIAEFDKVVANAQDILDRAHHCADSIKSGNGMKVYDPLEALAAAASKGDMIATLQQTLQQELLKLLYQPIVSLRGKVFEFYEIRLRMLDTKGKELPLVDLLEVASNSGMAEQIDKWVIVNSLKEVAKMRAAGHNPRVFVQIGSDTLRNDGLLDWIKKLFATTKLPPESLLIEFTENDAATYLKQAQTLIEGLKEIKCQTAISDFGKDANSMLTLTHLSVDFVKVTPSLVQALRKQEGVDKLTEVLTQLRALDRKSIVPFVETASILSVLWQAGADYIQGYYLQRPMPDMSYDFSMGQ